MPIPENASSVHYRIRAYDASDDDPEIVTEFSLPIHYGRPFASVEDDAARAAADAYVNVIKAAYPSVPVVADRTYTCDAPGDTWPTPQP
jgi:hypothetical protein